MSADPGSTAGGGRPDTPNTGFSVENDSRDLRWEIFNLFNTVNFGMPENNIDSIDFAKVISTVGGPRVSQFGLRVMF